MDYAISLTRLSQKSTLSLDTQKQDQKTERRWDFLLGRFRHPPEWLPVQDGDRSTVEDVKKEIKTW